MMIRLITIQAAIIFQITNPSQCFTVNSFVSNGRITRHRTISLDNDEHSAPKRRIRDSISKQRTKVVIKATLGNDSSVPAEKKRRGGERRKQQQQQQHHFRTTNPRSLAVLALMKTSLIGNNSNNNKAVTHLESNPDYLSLQDQRDKSFARKLVSTTQRHLGQIDKVLSHCCDSSYPPRKKRNKYSMIVQATLRIGAAQILFMDVPEFAAVKETVELLKNSESSSGSEVGGTSRYHVPIALIKFTNAVLRKVNSEGRNILQKHSSLEDNVSPWLIRQWKHDWGEEKTAQIVKQLFDEDSNDHIDLTLNFPQRLSDTERNVEEGRLLREFAGFDGVDNGNINENLEKRPIVLLPNGSLRIKRRGIVSNWPLYQEGEWWVQDVSSTLPAIALCKALQQRHDDLSGLHVVDMCAAPGGKTAQLLLGGFGHVTAVEGNAKRSRRLVENLRRLQLQDECQIIVSKGQEWVPLARKKEEGDEVMGSVVNGILVDVPCSATGTGSRRPDVLCKDSNIEHLIEIQEELANHCADKIISVGGVMVYATCSLLKAESEDQVRKLINRGDESEGHAIMQTIPFTSGEINGFDNAIDENGWLRVLPGTLGGDLNSCDGFFVARLLRIK